MEEIFTSTPSWLQGLNTSWYLDRVPWREHCKGSTLHHVLRRWTNEVSGQSARCLPCFYFVLFWCQHTSIFYSEQRLTPSQLTHLDKSSYAGEGERQEEDWWERNVLQLGKLEVAASYFSPLPLRKKKSMWARNWSVNQSKMHFKSVFVTNTYRTDPDLVSTISWGLC